MEGHQSGMAGDLRTGKHQLEAVLETDPNLAQIRLARRNVHLPPLRITTSY